MVPHILQNFEDCLSMVPQLMQYFFSTVEEGSTVDLLPILSPKSVVIAPVGLKVSSISGLKLDLSFEL
jgi:hypothetical protein